MLREQVRVMAVEGDFVEVMGYRQSGCAGCHAKASCTMMAGVSQGQETRLRVRNTVQAEVGELVNLEITEKQFLNASFLVYIAPVICLLVVGGVISSLLTGWLSQDMADALGALAGLAAMAGFFLWLRHHTHLASSRERYQPVISRGDQGASHCDDFC